MDLISKDAIESSKQHDIEMGNILIAEFMGVKTITIDRLKSILKQNREDGFISTPQAYTLDELKYDSSWDWLMPVVDKIKILVMEDDSDELYNSEEWDNITHTLVQIEIKSVYQAVVEFIKNQNN